MDRKSRHKIAQSEKLLSAALQERDQRLKEFLLRGAPTHARHHATAVAAIVLAGQPRIYEPLDRAWARALRQYGIRENNQHAAAQRLYPTIVGEREECARFTELFRRAPVWLLQFTGMALDGHQFCRAPTVSAIVAPRAPKGFALPVVVSRAVWCSVSALSSAPISTTIIDSQIQNMNAMMAPSEP